MALQVSASSFTVAWHGDSVLPGPAVIAGGAVWSEAGDGTLYALDMASSQVRFQQGIAATIGWPPVTATGLRARRA